MSGFVYKVQRHSFRVSVKLLRMLYLVHFFLVIFYLRGAWSAGEYAVIICELIAVAHFCRITATAGSS